MSRPQHSRLTGAKTCAAGSMKAAAWSKNNCGGRWECPSTNRPEKGNPYGTRDDVTQGATGRQDCHNYLCMTQCTTLRRMGTRVWTGSGQLWGWSRARNRKHVLPLAR